MPARSSNEVGSRRVTQTKPFLALPSAAHFVRCLGAAVYICLLFAVVYGGCDYLTSLHPYRVRVDFNFERRLPFVPTLSPIYSSLYPMFYLVPFVLRTKAELIAYLQVVTRVTLIAGLCFLLVPSEFAFPLPVERDGLPLSFRFADTLNLTYNMIPSLHVAYAALHAELFRKKGCRACWIFHLWAVAIALAAWLTYQHHVVDLIAGYLLGQSAASSLFCDHRISIAPSSEE